MDLKPHRRRAAAEVEAYWESAGVILDERRGDTVYLNPIDWWNDNSTEFCLHSVLAGRLLAIPATQVQSERMLSITR